MPRGKMERLKTVFERDNLIIAAWKLTSMPPRKRLGLRPEESPHLRIATLGVQFLSQDEARFLAAALLDWANTCEEVAA